MNEIEDVASPLIKEIVRLYEEDSGPFPLDDCNTLRRQSGKRYRGLSADLNSYFLRTSGPASWGSDILQWSEEKIQEVKATLARPFFEVHPEYKPLDPLISASNTPELFRDLLLHERLRQLLLKLLSHILASRT